MSQHRIVTDPQGNVAAHGEDRSLQGRGRHILHLAFPLFAAAGIGAGVTVLVLYLFTYFVQPIATEFGINESAVAGALSIYLAALIVSLPLAGMVADRFGARLTIIVSGLLYAACLIWISQVRTPLELYVAFAAAAVLGAGAGPTSYTRAIVSRFDRNRGLALGVALAGGGVAQIILPQVVRPVIAEEGWRQGFIMLAAIAGSVALIAGSMASDRAHGRADARKLGGYDLRQALETRVFWMMALAFSCLGAVLAGVTSQLVQIWASFGLDASAVPAFQAVIGASAIAGRIFGGALMDRVPARLVGAAAAIAGALGVALIAGGNVYGFASIAAGIGIGICTGSESDVVSFLTSRFFGLKNFSRIYGMLAAAFMTGAALGPIGLAAAAVRFGYSPMLMACSGLLVLSAAALASLKAPPAWKAEEIQ